MTFDGFTADDFNVFHIEGLLPRKRAIEDRIQPKFRIIGDELTEDLSGMIGSEMYLHIARHARRTVNPPNDTWLAIAGDKRGYKKHPHFQIGLWDDRVFIWLAYIYELPRKTEIANTFLQHMNEISNLSSDHYVISLDHTKKDAKAIEQMDLKNALERLRDVKKAEFLVGKQLFPTNPVLANGNEFIQFAKQTFEQLIPLYRLSYQ
ncbi:DUF1054 domain-containing protein [Pseudogracilibacillus sp. SE30717A]|uniref:YktB family protein n=1 Tax=Pseudogracilibacillus sp. SE30717A TaxID=3098293 RepID=UPI00300DE3CB